VDGRQLGILDNCRDDNGSKLERGTGKTFGGEAVQRNGWQTDPS